MSTEAGNQTIVVGVDGSPGAVAALDWAVEEAKLRGAQLRAVHVYPATPNLTGQTAADYYPPLEASAREALDAMLADVASLDGLDHTREVVAGSAAEVLIGLSEGATLLVVGSRGLGGFAGLVLGSVSAQCAQHADCPVVVVRVR